MCLIEHKGTLTYADGFHNCEQGCNSSQWNLVQHLWTSVPGIAILQVMGYSLPLHRCKISMGIGEVGQV